MQKLQGSILLLTILSLISQTSASKLTLPKIRESTTFGEGNPFIEGISFTLGSSLSIYNALMWVNAP